MRIHGLVALTLVMLVAAVPAAGGESVDGAVDPADVAALDVRTLLLDIRDAAEFDEGHIPGSINLPRARLEFDLEDLAVFDGLDASARRQYPIVLYCQHGYRSAAARDALRAMGYSAVSSVAGGYAAWRRAQASDAEAIEP